MSVSVSAAQEVFKRYPCVWCMQVNFFPKFDTQQLFFHVKKTQRLLVWLSSWVELQGDSDTNKSNLKHFKVHAQNNRGL